MIAINILRQVVRSAFLPVLRGAFRLVFRQYNIMPHRAHHIKSQPNLPTSTQQSATNHAHKPNQIEQLREKASRQPTTHPKVSMGKLTKYKKQNEVNCNQL